MKALQPLMSFVDQDRREAARQAAIAIRRALTDPASAGEPMAVHLLLARPRRGTWMIGWANLPGFKLDRGAQRYYHTLLPGWQYTAEEMKTELIADLEHFAATGEQPKEATR
jgi:hypothetical protein